MKSFGSLTALALMVLSTPARAGDAPPDKAKPFLVPYRLTATKHVLVRAKINGKGPFNFILDTGAPMLFVVPKVAEKIGVKPDRAKMGVFDSFELEGGVTVPKVKARIEGVFQLEGMNGLGLAGVELHGVIGYNVLARFRITFDFTSDKLALTPLRFDPQVPVGVVGKMPAGLETIGNLMKVLGGVMGRKPNRAVVFRGFLGLALAEAKNAVSVKSTFPAGPAAMAGIKRGDRITTFQGKSVQSVHDVERLAQKVQAGDDIKLTVERGTEKTIITFKAGDGI